MSDTLTKLVVQIGADVADLKRGMADAQKSTSTFKDTYLAMTGAIASANLGSKVVDATKQAVSGFADLQQSVANISTIAPTIDTSKVFASLNEMQTRVPQTAAQLGDALYNVFSSVDVAQEDALKLVETFSRGAVGAATDAQTFGTAVMGVMNAYGLSVKEAEHVSDVFFTTVQKGVITGQELATSLGPVTQAAKAAGVSLDELGGFIAGVTKEGGPAAQNVNNLANFLSKVTTADAQKALNDMGVATVDAAGRFRPMTEVLTDLKGKLSGMTEAAKLSAIQTIFPDAQARQGAMTLISQLDNVKAAIESNRTATGVAASAYEKMSQTWAAQSQLLQNSVSAALTQIAAQVLPSVTPFLTAFAEKIPQALHATGEAIGFAQQHADEIQAVLIVIGGGVTAVVVPAIVTWTTVTWANVAALTAQATAAAVAYAPAVALGVAFGGAVLLVIKFHDAIVDTIGRLLELSHIPALEKLAENIRNSANEAERFSQAVKPSAEIAALTTQFDGLKAAGATLGQQVQWLNGSWQSYTAQIQNAFQQSGELARAHELTTEKAAALQKQIDQGGVGLDALRQIAQKAGFEMINLGDGTLQFSMSAKQADQAAKDQAASVQKAADAARDATAQTIPFGAALLEIKEKAKSTADAFDMAIKKIDEMAGRMTGTEQVLTRQTHSLDAVASSAQAAFSSQNADSVKYWADQAKYAADQAGLGEKPTARLDELIDAIAKHTPGSAGALAELNRIIKESKAPMDDANKAYADQRQLTGDLAKEQLGLQGSLDALRGSLETFVNTFLLMMGRVPPNADAVSTETLRAFSISGPMQVKGSEAIQGFITGMIIQRAQAEETARIIALGAVVATEGALQARSPSRVMQQRGEWFGQGFVQGIRNLIGAAVTAAKELADKAVAAVTIKDAGKSPLGGTETPQPASPAGANAALAAGFAASIAPLDAARTALRANQAELAATNARLLELHRELLNMGPHDANRKAVEDEIRQLQQTKGELQSAVTGYQALVKELNNGTTAAQGFTGAMATIQQTQHITEQFGATGAAAISAFGDALSDDSPAAGAKAAQAANAVVAAARAAGVPGWEGLAAAQAEAWQRALEERTPEAIQAAIDATQAITDATRAQLTLNGQTFGAAFATAVNAQGLAEQLGSQWASGFAALDKAWHEGGASNIQAAAQWAAQVQQTIGTLPAGLRDQIAPEWAAAIQEMIDNPSQDAEDRVRTLAGRIHQASQIIPKNFKDLVPDVQQYILQLVQSVADGSLSIEDATTAAGEAAKLIPSGFKKMLPEVQAIINGYALSVRSGSMDVTTALQHIDDVQKLIPNNLRELTPAVQREILAIVQAWQAGAITIEQAQERINGVIKAGEETARKAKEQAEAIKASIAQAAAAFGTSGAMQQGGGGGSEGGNAVSSQQNAYGIPGFSTSTVTEPGRPPVTTLTYQGRSVSVTGQVSLADVMAFFGFTNEAAFDAWKKAQANAAAAAGGSGPSGAGLGMFGTNLYDVAALIAALMGATPHAQGGVTDGRMVLTGEKGPELGILPRGTTIMANADSKTFIKQAARMLGMSAYAEGGVVGGGLVALPKPAADVQSYVDQWGTKMVRVYDASGWHWVPESLYQSSYLGAAATAMAAGHPASSALPAATAGGAHSLMPTASQPVVVNVYGDVFDTDNQFQKKVQQALASAQQRRY